MSFEKPQTPESRFKVGDLVNIPSNMRESNEPSSGWYIKSILEPQEGEGGLRRYILVLLREGKHPVYLRATQEDLEEAN